MRAFDLLQLLSRYPFFRSFLLVGGAATALHLSHRDFDHLCFSSLEEKLSVESLTAMVNVLSKKGLFVSPLDNGNLLPPTVLKDSIYSPEICHGLEIQGVKTIFFVPSSDLRYLFLEDKDCFFLNEVKVASLEANFLFKALLLADRFNDKDLIDILQILNSSWARSRNFNFETLYTIVEEYRGRESRKKLEEMLSFMVSEFKE